MGAALEMLDVEVLLIHQAARELQAGKHLSDENVERLALATRRVSDARSVATAKELSLMDAVSSLELRAVAAEAAQLRHAASDDPVARLN